MKTRLDEVKDWINAWDAWTRVHAPQLPIMPASVRTCLMNQAMRLDYQVAGEDVVYTSATSGNIWKLLRHARDQIRDCVCYGDEGSIDHSERTELLANLDAVLREPDLEYTCPPQWIKEPGIVDAVAACSGPRTEAGTKDKAG